MKFKSNIRKYYYDFKCLFIKSEITTGFGKFVISIIENEFLKDSSEKKAKILYLVFGDLVGVLQ